MRLLAPTLDDLDLVLSWLPTHGAEEFRTRVIDVRNQLLGESSHATEIAGIRGLAAADTEVLATWLAAMEQELDEADNSRAQRITQLFTFLDG